MDDDNKRRTAVPAYVAAPPAAEPTGNRPDTPINGLEQGYRDMVDQFAAEGYVVIAPEWQTYNRTPVMPWLKAWSDTNSYLVTRWTWTGNRLASQVPRRWEVYCCCCRKSRHSSQEWSGMGSHNAGSGNTIRLAYR
jgi:hypothetical protein